MRTALSDKLTNAVHPAGTTNNSNLGLWLGIAYLVAFLVCWIPIDLWLHRTGRPYITTCVRRLLESGSWYAIIAVCFLGAIAALAAYHFFYERTLS